MGEKEEDQTMLLTTEPTLPGQPYRVLRVMNPGLKARGLSWGEPLCKS